MTGQEFGGRSRPGVRVMSMARLRWKIRRIPRRLGYLTGPRLMSAIRKRWVLLRHLHAHVIFEGPVYIGPGFSLHIPDDGSFIVGPGVEFRRGFRAEVAGGGSVTIGAGSVFTYDVLIQCSTTVEIGERCIFAQGSSVFDGSHRFRDPDRPMLSQGYDYRPIRIASDVSVMAKCTVLGDIGDHAFVGANSVVTRRIPPYTVAVGAPARAIEYFGPPGLEPPELKRAKSGSST